MIVKRIKTEKVINVTIDYHTKQVRLEINKVFITGNPSEENATITLSKRKVTQLIAALKAQRDRKGVK